jgi:glycerophosphoryl diester phosphodiesterase
MLVLAHRGLSAHYPENTEIAFIKAIEGGAKAIECDVHQVGEDFVIFHDYRLERLTNKHGLLASQTPDDLAALRVKEDHTILTLAQLFDVIRQDILVNLEIKSLNDTHAFIQQLIECTHNHPAQIVLSSFNHPLVASLRAALRNTRLEHKVKLAVLVAHLPANCSQFALEGAALGAEILAIDAHLVDANFVQQAHLLDLHVWCYTVNDQDLLLSLIDMKVDGVFCDDVTWANDLLNKLS